VMYALQDGDETPVRQVVSTGADLTFDVPLRVAEGADGPRFLGPYVRREGLRRFVYFRVGVSAGQHDSPWSRRGKIFITDIPETLLRRALESGHALAATFPGSDRKGEPSCATVRPLDGWRLA
jgi:hypothetical protein